MGKEKPNSVKTLASKSKQSTNRTKVLIIIALIILTILVKLPIVNTPYMDDAAFWYVSKAMLIQEQNLDPIFRGKGLPSALEEIDARKHPWLQNYISDFTHPPMFYEILATSYMLFGYSVQVSHIIIIFLSSLGIVFAYLLGKELYGNKAGLFAAIGLLFTPIVFTQIGRIYPEILLMSFSLMAFYFMLKENKLMYIITGGVLVLLKEQGIIAILAILFYILIKEISDEQLFGKWNKETKKKIIGTISKLLTYAIPLFILIGWYIYHYIKTGLLLYADNYSKQAIGFEIIQNILFYVKFILIDQYRFILTIIIILAIVWKKYEIRKIEVSMWLMVLGYVLLMAWSNQGYLRHIVPAIPILFLMGGGMIQKIRKEKLIILGIGILVVVLSVSIYHTPTDYNYEENMRYKDLVDLQIQTVDFIQTDYSNRLVWVDLFTYLDMGYPYMGYVEESMNIGLIPTDYLKFPEAKKSFTDNFAKGDLVVENSLYTYEKRNDYVVIRNLDLKLIETFEKNQDFIKIYEVN